jgi:hypothetical protein
MPNSTPVITFAQPQLTPISREPTNSSLKLFQAELNANTISIPSHRGGGAHGHLDLIQSPANYLILTGVIFTPPGKPGPAPTQLDNATSNQITATNHQFQADQAEYALYLAVERTLKAQLIAAINPLFINKLHNNTMSFVNATTLQLLSHLHTSYGKV